MSSSTRRWLAASVATLAITATATFAFADQTKAKELYDDGEKAYNLGQFDKAIELFTKAYEEWPEPAFLFNIAQAYRQASNCKQALFFYKRFMSLKENDTKKPIKPEVKKDVEARIAELEECVKRDLANKPPDSLDNGAGGTGSTTTTGGGTTTTGGGTTTTGGGKTTGGTGGTTTTTGGGKTTGGTGGGKTTGGTTTGGTTTGGTRVAGNGDGDGDSDSDSTDTDSSVNQVVDSSTQPKLFAARVTAGASVIGAGNLKSTVAPTVAIVGGYPLAINPQLELDLGAQIDFTTFPYGSTDGSGDGSAAWTSILANVGAAYTVVPKIAVRADVGVGMLLFTGLKKANPFTEMGAEASGALSVLGVRFGVSGEYAITKNIVAEVTPFAFEYSPAPAHFNAGVTSLTTISFMAGIGYRM